MPSLLHEERVNALRTMCNLTGCSEVGTLGEGLLPDVYLVDSASNRRIIGDAKASETPGCSATQRRLGRYLRAVVIEADPRWRTRIALAAGADPAWLHMLASLASNWGLEVQRRGSTRLDTLSIHWIDT